MKRTGISGLSNFLSVSIPLNGCPMLNSAFVFGRAWMLWSVPSLLTIFSGWPAWMPKMCGWYWQPCWSSSTGVVGAG